ncbi:MAG: metalloregulator ArsR/SmtB family transcription factor [Saprospiraceae bacterium]
MAFSKANLYHEREQRISEFMRLGGHPARLIILYHLYLEGPCTVEEITAVGYLRQSTVSRHLATLRDQGMVLYEEVNPYIYYTLDGEMMKKMEEEIMRFFERFRSRDQN